MILFPIAGALLLLLLLVDVFVTVFHAQGQGGPVNRRLSRLIWACTRALGQRGDGSKRERLLALGGPVLVVATLLVWTVFLVAGFTLIYYPWIQAFLVSPGSLRTPWVEALYYSGYTASTLGLGDVIADSEVLRVLTLLEAFGGFALLSIATSYSMSVYRELITMKSVAVDISGLFSAGEDQVVEFTRHEGYETLARWSERISSSLSSVLVAHSQYPVLHYFRPQKESQALPVQLGALLRLRALVAADHGAAPLSTLRRHPSYLALMDGLESYLKEVDRLFVPEVEEQSGAGTGSGDELERPHARLLDYMLYA